MDPATALMLSKLLFSGIQYASGAMDAKNQTRPQMPMPQGMIDALNIFQRRAGETRLPGQDAFEDEIDLDVANNMAKAMTVAGGPSGAQYVTTISGQGLEGKRKIAADAAAYQDANEVRLANHKKDMAALENQIFNVNQLAPYLDAMKAASAKMGAGITNAFSTADSMVSYGQSKDYLKEVGFYANGGSRGETMTPMTPQGINPKGTELFPVPGSSEGGLASWGTNPSLTHLLEYSKYFTFSPN